MGSGRTHHSGVLQLSRSRRGPPSHGECHSVFLVSLSKHYHVKDLSYQLHVSIAPALNADARLQDPCLPVHEPSGLLFGKSFHVGFLSATVPAAMSLTTTLSRPDVQGAYGLIGSGEYKTTHCTRIDGERGIAGVHGVGFHPCQLVSQPIKPHGVQRSMNGIELHHIKGVHVSVHCKRVCFCACLNSRSSPNQAHFLPGHHESDGFEVDQRSSDHRLAVWDLRLLAAGCGYGLCTCCSQTTRTPRHGDVTHALWCSDASRTSLAKTFRTN